MSVFYLTLYYDARKHKIKKKNVEFYSKNNFEKFVHLVCFIIRILGLYLKLDHAHFYIL